MEIAIYLSVGLVFFVIDIWLLVKRTGKRFFSKKYYKNLELAHYDDRELFKSVDKDDINQIILFELRRDRFMDARFWWVSVFIFLFWPVYIVWLVIYSFYKILNFIFQSIGRFVLGIVPFIGKHLTKEYMKSNAEKYI